MNIGISYNMGDAVMEDRFAITLQIFYGVHVWSPIEVKAVWVLKA